MTELKLYEYAKNGAWSYVTSLQEKHDKLKKSLYLDSLSEKERILKRRELDACYDVLEEYERDAILLTKKVQELNRTARQKEF